MTANKRDYKVCLFDLRPSKFFRSKAQSEKQFFKTRETETKKLISKSRKRPQNSFEKVRSCPKKRAALV